MSYCILALYSIKLPKTFMWKSLNTVSSNILQYFEQLLSTLCQPTQHIDASSPNVVLSKQHKTTQLVCSYILTLCWKHESETVAGRLLT